MHVILFDIDGTLLNTGGAGTAALHAAMSVGFGATAIHEVAVHGRTDRGIAAALFQLHAVDDSEENWIRFRDHYLDQLRIQLPQRKGHVLPGVVELLDQLRQRDSVALGLLTGNTQAGAQIKLEHYRLFDRFAFGGFGDHHPLRDDVAREALKAANGNFNGQIVSEKIWVIGDTPADVQCARAIGARALAVATGIHSRDELGAAKPDILFDNFEDTEKALAAILCK